MAIWPNWWSMTRWPFTFEFSVENCVLGSAGGEMTPRGALNAKPQPGCCFAAVNFLCRVSEHPPEVKSATITHRCFFPFSLLSFSEWTHLLLSGPHVPLVLADLKAPVQHSPCIKRKKKRKTHTFTSFTVLFTGLGQTGFALSWLALAGWNRGYYSGLNWTHIRAKTFRSRLWLAAVSSSACLIHRGSKANQGLSLCKSEKNDLQTVFDLGLLLKPFVPNTNMYHTKQMMDYISPKVTLLFCFTASSDSLRLTVSHSEPSPHRSVRYYYNWHDCAWCPNVSADFWILGYDDDDTLE